MLIGEKSRRRSFHNYILFFLLLAAIWANVKSIFMNCDVDTEYAAAMSYRMLQGDGMFREMWEPHQTSAFLCTLLMKPFVAITGGTTGVLLYLHTAGVLIHGVIAWLFYSFLRKRTDLDTARLMGIFFLAARPKDIVFPEFSNMQIWFSVLLFLSLLYYLEHQEKKRWLLLASVCLCLEVLSYPSCVIVWLAAVALLCLYSCEKGKDILLFSAACLLQGAAYVGYFVARCGGAGKFLEALYHIAASDASHQEAGKAEMGFFLENFAVSLFLILICFLAALLFHAFGAKDAGKRNSRFFFWFGSTLFVVFLVRTVILADRMGYAGLYVLVTLAALFLARKCEACERRIVYAGILISAGSFAATALLTNLDLSSICMYLILGAAVSFIPLRKLLPKETELGRKRVTYDLALLLCAVVVLQRGTTVKTYTGFSSPVQLGGVIRSGPALGIVTDYLGAYVRNTSIGEWGQFVHAGDNVLIVEQGGVSTLGYLYSDTGVSVPSTICTPTYDETLLEYWEKYPEKFPDVVAVQCWYGELKVDADSWAMQWLEKECGEALVEEGTFWRFYRLTEG